jgi:hypothetical protein
MKKTMTITVDTTNLTKEDEDQLRIEMEVQIENYDVSQWETTFATLPDVVPTCEHGIALVEDWCSMCKGSPGSKPRVSPA